MPTLASFPCSGLHLKRAVGLAQAGSADDTHLRGPKESDLVRSETRYPPTRHSLASHGMRFAHRPGRWIAVGEKASSSGPVQDGRWRRSELAPLNHHHESAVSRRMPHRFGWALRLACPGRGILRVHGGRGIGDSRWLHPSDARGPDQTIVWSRPPPSGTLMVRNPGDFSRSLPSKAAL
jgi:hypothetical protein